MEEVKLIDDFTNPKTNRTSNCFRIAYRSNERCVETCTAFDASTATCRA